MSFNVSLRNLQVWMRLATLLRLARLPSRSNRMCSGCFEGFRAYSFAPHGMFGSLRFVSSRQRPWTSFGDTFRAENFSPFDTHRAGEPLQKEGCSGSEAERCSIAAQKKAKCMDFALVVPEWGEGQRHLAPARFVTMAMAVATAACASRQEVSSSIASGAAFSGASDRVASR